MVHPLGQLVPLQDTLFQVDDVWVLALNAAQRPELPQGQFHILWRVAADLLHRHPGPCTLHHCLIDHAVAATPHLLDEFVLRLAAYHPSMLAVEKWDKSSSHYRQTWQDLAGHFRLGNEVMFHINTPRETSLFRVYNLKTSTQIFIALTGNNFFYK